MDKDQLARPDGPSSGPRARTTLELDVAKFSSVALARLVDEVKSEELPSAANYNRTYNRHNR